jgi:CheY-like chemotaxis protein
MLGPVCIVIAEDNYVLRRVVVQYLATFGITAIEAGTETEAWSALATGGADVLVLDLLISSTRTMLPFLQRIRKEPSMQDLPVVVTTAFEIESLSSSDEGACLAECFILQKPYDLCQLRRAIIQALGKRRKRLESSVS